MIEALLRRIARRCPTHDRPSPLLIAELETELGLNPHALTKLHQRVHHQGAAEFIDRTLLDCGHDWCPTRQETT